MLRLPPHFAEIILAFAPVFVQQRTWRHAQLLLLGALLAPGHRTVSSFLRIIGVVLGATLRQLPPRAQPCDLEQPTGCTPATRSTDQPLRFKWSNRAGRR